MADEAPREQGGQQLNEGHEDPAIRANLEKLRAIVEKEKPPQELTSANFDELITNNKRLVILDINQSWCEPCHVLAPLLKDLGALFHDQIQVVSFTGDQNPETEELSKKLPAARGWPTLVYYQGGKEMHTKTGSPSVIEFLEMLQSLGLKLDPEKHHQALLLMAEHQASKVFDEIAKIPSEYQAECLAIAVEKHPAGALFNYPKYKNLACAAAVLEKAVRGTLPIESLSSGNLSLGSGAQMVLEHSNSFADQPYAKDILLQAAQMEPQYACYNFEKYGSQPYAVDVLKVTADKSPKDYVRLFSVIKTKASLTQLPAMNKIFEDAVFNLQNRDDQTDFMNNAGEIIHHDFTNGIPGYGVHLLDEAIAKNPVNGILAPRQYENLPDAENRLKNAIQRTLELDPTQILIHLSYIFWNEIIKDKNFEEKIVTEVAKKIPLFVLKNYFYINDKPYRGKVLRVVAEQLEKTGAPEEILRYANIFAKELGNDFLAPKFKKYCLRFPGLCVKAAEQVVAVKGGESLVLKAMEADPKAALLDWNPYGRLAEQPAFKAKLKLIVEKMLATDPGTILLAFQNYKLDGEEFKDTIAQARKKLGLPEVQE